MADIEMRWYVLRATSGKEGKAKEYIDALISQGGFFAKNVAQCLIPTEKRVTNRKDGKRVVKIVNRFPGYVFVQANLVGEISDILRNVPNVYDFLKATKTAIEPMPLRADEVNYMLGSIDEMQDVAEEVVVDFSIGESVKVNDGPFAGFDAVVEEVSVEKKKLKVSVKIFGRKTPLELGFAQVDRL